MHIMTEAKIDTHEVNASGPAPPIRATAEN
jgi:hypothetical protein